jgi:hypothetical protein
MYPDEFARQMIAERHRAVRESAEGQVLGEVLWTAQRLSRLGQRFASRAWLIVSRRVHLSAPARVSEIRAPNLSAHDKRHGRALSGRGG